MDRIKKKLWCHLFCIALRGVFALHLAEVICILKRNSVCRSHATQFFLFLCLTYIRWGSCEHTSAHFEKEKWSSLSLSPFLFLFQTVSSVNTDTGIISITSNLITASRFISAFSLSLLSCSLTRNKHTQYYKNIHTHTQLAKTNVRSIKTQTNTSDALDVMCILFFRFHSILFG